MTNAFKIGLFNVDGEKNAQSLPVNGNLPDWLLGSYITNGPAIFDLKDYSLNHWFDGLAMLTSYTFNENGVDYVSRFIRSEDYGNYAKTGVVDAPTFGTKGHKQDWNPMKPGMEGGADNPNINLSRINGRFYALDESAAIIEFDLLTLETKNEIKNRPGVRGQLTTAHPIADVTTGETVNYTVNVGPQTTYNIFSFNPDVGNVKMISSIPVKEPSYMHSFAMTSGHVILTQCPMVANPLSFLEFSKSVYERYEWKQNLKTRFTIVPRAGGTVIEKETEPLYCYHHVNAFEKDGAIISDLVSYPGPTTLEALMLKNLRSDSPKDLYGGQLKRFSIPLEEGGKVTDQTLSSESLEFPRIDPRRMLSNYRFVYGSGPTSKDGTDFWDQLLKIDTSDGTAKRWKCEGCYPGEAVFVPRPEGEKEDDGLVLSNVLDTGRKISFLLVLDAASFNEIARIDAPQLIPFKFHGNFFRAN